MLVKPQNAGDQKRDNVEIDDEDKTIEGEWISTKRISNIIYGTRAYDKNCWSFSFRAKASTTFSTEKLAF